MIAKSRMKALASAMIMLGIMIISCNSATAEANSNSGLKQVKKGFSLDNPQFAIRSFFECFDKSEYAPEKAVRAMNTTNLRGGEDKRDLAIKLKKIIDAGGLYIDVKRVSLDPNFVDSVTMTNQYKVVEDIPEIYLEKYKDKWMFSATTVENIDEIYDRMVPFDVSRIVDMLPNVFRLGVWGLELWQVMGLALYLAFGFFLAKFLSVISKYVLQTILTKIGKEEIGKTAYIIPMARHSAKVLALIILIAIIPTLELPFKINAFVLYTFKVLLPVFVVLILFKAIDIFSEFLQKIAERTKNTLDDHLVPFASKALKGFVIVLGAFYVLDILNVNITPLLAGVSIGGLAFALAAQDTVKNIFGSLTIFVDQPFIIGDWIKFSDGEGVIEEIGLRSTRIRTFEDSVITIPNGKLADAVINNIGRRNARRYSPVLGIMYNTPQAKIESFVKGIEAIILNHPATKKDNVQVSFYSYNSSSLDIRVVMFFELGDIQEELRAREAINMQIFQLAEELGVSFAFPSQSLYIEQSAPKQIKPEANKGTTNQIED